MTMKSSSVGAKFGAFGAHFGVDLGRFWGRFGAWGAPVGRSEANLDTSALKRGGGSFSPSLSGQKKWAWEVAGK